MPEPKPKLYSDLYSEPLISPDDFDIKSENFGGAFDGSVKVYESGDSTISLGNFRLDSKHGVGVTAGFRLARDFKQAGGFDLEYAGGEVYMDGHWALGPKLSAKVSALGHSLTLAAIQVQTTRDTTLKLGVRFLGYGHNVNIKVDTARIAERMDARFSAAMVEWGVPHLP